MNKIDQAAERLRGAEETKITCEPIRDLLGITNLEDAYAVQQINSELRLTEGAKIVGSKIGLTAPVVQKQLGVDQPDFGSLWDDREIKDGGNISMSELMQPKAEAEIAFMLGKDLDKEGLTIEELKDAIDYALVSIEIVGSRIKNWDIKITDTIADNASASHWVIGSKKTLLKDVDLEHCKMTMTSNSETVSEGVGSNCLGSPLNAMLWLAQKMISLGNPLKAGHLILSGALGPMYNINEGDDITATIEGLGSVNVKFTK